jgi:hypothetical protein
MNSLPACPAMPSLRAWLQVLLGDTLSGEALILPMR